eukprot:2493140-Pyramimonas_sp.AAC.1
MYARTEYKRRKYEDTLKGLREDGWEPELHTLVLGTLGEIPSTAVQVIRGNGRMRAVSYTHLRAHETGAYL